MKNIEKILKLCFVLLILLDFSSCRAQDYAEAELKDADDFKSAWKMGNVFLSNYSNYALEDNTQRLIDSLTQKGVDKIVVYKFGEKCYKCSYQGIYLMFEFNGFGSFYEIGTDGLYRSFNCAYFKYSLNPPAIEPKDKIENTLNQYRYQDLEFYWNGVIDERISIKNEIFPTSEFINIFNEIKTNIVNCFYVNEERGFKKEKMSD